MAEPVGGPDHLPAGGTATGKQDRHRTRPVVAARFCLPGERGELWGAAKLPQRDHHRGLEEPARVEIVDQRGDGLVPGGEPGLEGDKERAVVVPAAVVDRHERHPRLDEPAGEEGLLAEGVAPVGIADTVGLGADVEGGLGRGGGDEVVAAGVVLVDAADRIAGGRIVKAGKAVGERPEFAALGEARPFDGARCGEIADPEARRIGIVADDKWGVLGAEEVRAAGAGHAGQREVAGEAVRRRPLVPGDRAHAGVEADKRTAADRDPRRSAGHHVMVAGAVVALVVAHRTDDGELVGDLRQLRHMLGELDPRHARRDRRKLAADLGRGIGLGIEGLEVRWAAIHPDEDAVGRGTAGRIGCPRCADEAKEIEKASSGQSADAKLHPAAPAHRPRPPGEIGVYGIVGIVGIVVGHEKCLCKKTGC